MTVLFLRSQGLEPVCLFLSTFQSSYIGFVHTIRGFQSYSAGGVGKRMSMTSS